ncbi:MAG: hypothetical protein ACI4TP_07365, partial [Anaerotignum sp.]
MATDIGAKIGIDGEAAFKSSLSAINSQLKNLGSEMKSVVYAFSGMENSEEAVAAKGDVLQRSIAASAQKIETLQAQSERAKKKLSTLADELENAKREFGENSEQALKAQNAYNRQVVAVNNLESQINRTTAEMKQMEREMGSLGAETDDLSGEMKNAEKDATSLKTVFAGALGANIAASAIHGLTNSVKNAVGSLKGAVIDTALYADSMITLATQTGISTDKLQEYQYMVELADVPLETITGSMSKLTKNMATASKGTGDAAAAFQSLGVEITNTDGSLRSNDDVFGEVIAKLGQMENETQRDAYAMQIFGKSAQDLNPLIALGADGFASLAEEARKMGFILDEESLQSLLAVSDAMERAKNVSTTIKQKIAAELAPTVSELATGFQEWAASVDWESVGGKIGSALQSARDFASAILDNKDAIIAAISGIATGLVAWNVASMIMGVVGAVDAFKKANETATTAQALFNAVMGANPAVKIASIVLGLVSALVVFIATNEEARAKLVAAWDAIKNGVGGAIEKLKSFGADLKEKFQSVIEWFLGIPSQMTEIGGNLLTGLWNGINDKIAWLKGKVQGVVDKIKSWFTGTEGFDTHSPSKWSEKIGGWVMDGLGVGVENGTDAILPVIKTTANRIGDVLESELAKTNAEIEAMQKKANAEQAEKELKQYRNSIAAKQKELEKAEKKNRQKILDEIAKIEADWNEKQVQAARNAEKEKLQERVSALQEFQKEYESALSSIESKQSSLQDKLSDYGSLFERVKTEEGNELFQLGDLDAEIKKIQKYSEAIDDMRAKGLSDGLMGEISAMSVDDALDYMDKLSRMSDKKLNDYIQKYDEKQRLAAEAAEKFYQSEFAALEQNYTEKLPQALGGVKEQLYQAGAQAAQSFAEGMAGNSEGGVSGAISAAVADAKAATQGDDMQRIVSGMQEQEPILTGYIQEMQKRMLEMLASSQGDYIDIGELMMDGLSQGIRNGQSGVVNAVAKVIAAAVRRAKNDLDINSPSKVFYGFGDYSMQGYEQGVKNRLKSVVKTMQDSMTMIQRVPQVATAGAGGNNNSRSYTYGDINIELEETTGTTYEIVPGNDLTKDPKVTVKAGSEDCWL